MEPRQKPLKILYLITKSNFGGAQRYVFDLATEALKAGHDVVVGFGGNGILANKLRDAGVRTIFIPSLERDVNIVADVKSFFTLIDIFSKESPDIVHLNSSKMGALGASAARLWNGWVRATRFFNLGGTPMRIVFTGHGWAFNEERGDIVRFIIGILHWITIELAHETIAVSKRTRDQVSALPFVWHKLKVIHNGVGPIAVLPKQHALQNILGTHANDFLRTEPIIIGTLAELHKNKGLSYAIEGIAQLKKQRPNQNILFVILGEGEERHALEALIQKLDLSSNVFLAGYKENGVTLLSAFDIFLLPSITEAFPYAILEAGKVGLPVIASNVGGIPEVIDDLQSGVLIQSKNPSEVARAIAFLIDNPERRASIGKMLEERIRNRFNIEAMANETFALYQQKT